MLDALKFFDFYTIRARIFPAIIAGLPAFSLSLLLVPWDHLGLPNVIVTTMNFLMLYALADIARLAGHKVEQKLGTRSTPHLWHRKNRELPNSTKDLCRTFMEKKLKRSAPTEADEINNLPIANDFYEGAGNWLREETRDTRKFKILFEILVTYGFRRNLLGLKIPTIILNTFIFFIILFLIFYLPLQFNTIQNLKEKLSYVLFFLLFHSIYFIFFVNKNSVIAASNMYGKQLILSCSSFVNQRQSKPRKKAE